MTREQRDAMRDLKNEYTKIEASVEATTSEGFLECQACEDTGWVHNDDAAGQFGGWQRCECQREEDRLTQIHSNRRESRLPRRYQKARFGNFDANTRVLARALEVCRRFAAGDLGPKFLMLYGDFGTGKSHLAASIINARIDSASEDWGRFESVPAMLQRFRAGYNDGSYLREFERVLDAPLLVLDDLGAEYQKTDSQTTWAADQLYQIINDRYMDEAELVVTTNARPDKLDPRIKERLMEVSTGFAHGVKLSGHSYRTRPLDTESGLKLLP